MHFLFELRFTAANHITTQIIGRVRAANDFNRITQVTLIRALAQQIRQIEANQLFLLDSLGGLIRRVALPDLSIPFFAPQPFRLLSNGNETRALLVPLDSPDGAPTVWTGGKYRFHFQLTRTRYPQDQPDPNAVYHREVELDLSW